MSQASADRGKSREGAGGAGHGDCSEQGAGAGCVISFLCLLKAVFQLCCGVYPVVVRRRRRPDPVTGMRMPCACLRHEAHIIRELYPSVSAEVAVLKDVNGAL